MENVKTAENEGKADRKICFSYIRFSSKPQGGNEKSSEWRQGEIAPKIAKEKGWIFDEKLNVFDPGISAYRGKNVEDGELGTLFRALKAGTIPKGRIMIVEAFDRLSRMKISKARRLFEDLLENGLEIYVNQDSKLYTEESLEDVMDLIMSLLRMEAAHQYSKRLSGFVADAYKKKKLESTKTGKPYRYRPFGWMKWDEEKKQYEEIPEKVASIKRLFTLANSGYGIRSITKLLNQENVPYVGACKVSRGWATISVNRILKGKEVLGLNTHLNPPVKMFPQIIDEKLYYSANQKLNERRTNKYFGRTNDARNLFTGIAKCSQCGRAMVYHYQKAYAKKIPTAGSKGGIGARGGQKVFKYLWCSGFVNGKCSSKQIPYDWVEESFSGLLETDDFIRKYGEGVEGKTEDTLNELRVSLEETRKILSQYTKDYEASPSNMLAGLMAKMEAKEKSILKEIDNSVTVSAGTTPIMDAWFAFEKDLTLENWEKPEFRIRIRDLIRSLVEKIVVDIPSKSYVVHFKNGKQVKVECSKKAFRIDGVEYITAKGLASAPNGQTFNTYVDKEGLEKMGYTVEKEE